jgi:GWxTD domain-containing protein
MRRVCWTILPILLCSALSYTNSATAQDQPPPQNTAPKPQSAKDRKQQARKLAKESAPYTTWETEEVPYIITKEELDAFHRLTANEEREQFIEEFWRHRNPDPDSPENAYREEHYRRIVYANERFSSGIPGWKTDRGHIYIL